MKTEGFVVKLVVQLVGELIVEHKSMPGAYLLPPCNANCPRANVVLKATN